MARGVIALLGSGETAPGMTKVHRQLLSRHHDVRAINLDTPYGFQENVPQMTEKLVDYFSTSLRTTLSPVSFLSYENASETERTIVRQRIREANYVFTGPGSPSYALAQWQPLQITNEFERVLDAGGTLCFSSAAVVTLGRYAAPIYEIYKVGDAPHWLEGLDLLGAAGLSCTAIPHFDNAEGANYDTRFCYLGERRLALLESLLPENVATLGVDEHTALILDLETDTAHVTGRSHAYWRLHGHTRTLENGTTTPLSELRNAEPPPRQLAPIAPADNDLVVLARRIERNDPDAGEALAQLMRIAQGAERRASDFAPLVNGLLTLRQSAKVARDYKLADELRDVLKSSGIEIQDGVDATTWQFADDSSNRNS